MFRTDNHYEYAISIYDFLWYPSLKQDLDDSFLSKTDPNLHGDPKPRHSTNANMFLEDPSFWYHPIMMLK